MKCSKKKGPLHLRQEGFFIRATVRLGLALLFFSFLFLEVSVFASSLIISQIQIQENEHIKSTEIENIIQSKVGNSLSEKMIREDMQAIYDMGYFREVEVLKEEIEDGLKLIFRVRENPQIMQIELEGIEEREAEKVRELVTLEEGQVLKFKDIKETRNRILDFYHRQGFFSSQVEVSQASLEENECKIVILIEKKERMKIAEVRIEDNFHLSSEEILTLLKIEPGQYFDEGKLREGIKGVIDGYQRRGYYFATFKEPRFESFERRGKRVNITLEVDEGKRIFVSQVNVEGNEHFTSVQILKTLKPGVGEVFVPEFLEESITRLDNKYGKTGHLYLEVDRDLQFDREKGKVAISLLIQEGSQVKVGKISIEGNQRSKERVFEHSLVLQEGEFFDVEKIRESWRRIYNLGFFEKVSIYPVPTSSREIMDLVIEVEEGERTGKLLFGVGYGQSSGWGGTIQIDRDNLWGEGKRISFNWEFAKNKNSYDISFLDRWWRNTDLSLDFSLYNIEDRYYDRENYQKRRSGGKIELGWPFQRYARGFLALRIERILISQVDEEPLPEDLEEGWKTRRSLELTFDRDTRVRDEAFNAYKGSYSHLFMETNGGPILKGDLNFTKYKAELREYWRKDEFWMSPILVLRLRGWLGEGLPSYEKFYAGGQRTLRGYDVNEFSGNKMLLGTLELRRPFSKNMSVLIFVDGAQIWDEDSPIPESKTGWGLGMRIVTPIGPLQLDWGIRETGEGTFYFGIGQAF